MNLSVVALLIYICILVFWSSFSKRNMAEGMLIGFLVICLFGKKEFVSLVLSSIQKSLMNEVLFASLMFILMSFLIVESGLLNKILLIFNSLLGGVKGGPAFVNVTLSAFFGMLSGSNSANTATSGAFTVPWMIETGWKPKTAATFAAGNGGLGAGFPPSASMFIMLGFAQVNKLISEEELYIGLFIAGIYQVLYRLILIIFLMKNEDIKKVKNLNQPKIINILSENWTALLVFLGAVIPVIVTIGPVSLWLSNRGIGELIESVSLLTWIPIMMIMIILILGWSNLKNKIFDINYCSQKLFPQYKTIGGVLLFAFAASEALADLGLANGLISIFEKVDLPKFLMVLFIGLLVVLVAGPLSSTATLTSIGLVAFHVLLSVGVSPLAAVVSILVFASTEGASPPASGSIFIASGLANVSPEETFFPLIKYFVIPITIVGWLVAMEFLPLFI